MDMYTPDQLQNIYGVGDPRAYSMAKDQVGISQQFGQGQAVQSEEKGKQAGLDTLFQQQNDPIKLQQAQSTLEGTNYDNVSKGVKSRLDVATEGFKLDDAKRAQALAMPEHEIKMMTAHAQQLAYSNDPAEQKEGQRLMQMSSAAVEARQKHKDEMEKQDLIRKSAERVGAGHDAAARYSADSRVRAASMRVGAQKTVDAQLMGAKTGEQRVGIFEAAARQLQVNGDDEGAQYYQSMALRESQRNYANRGAAAGAGQAGKPDMATYGVPVTGNVMPPAVSAPMPGSGPKKAAGTKDDPIVLK